MYISKKVAPRNNRNTHAATIKMKTKMGTILKLSTENKDATTVHTIIKKTFKIRPFILFAKYCIYSLVFKRVSKNCSPVP